MVVRSPVCIRRAICFLPSTTALTQQGRVAASCTEKRSPAASDPAVAPVPAADGDPAGGAVDGTAPCAAAVGGAAAAGTAAAVVAVDAGPGSDAGGGVWLGRCSAGAAAAAGAGSVPPMTGRPDVAKYTTAPAIGRLTRASQRNVPAVRRSLSTAS